ncbi:unnamed protein product [Tuber melanosporum]|uniref:(Perigord truffle) hypothetical protein n=1 Tax=Tuber melanosporum (strain Mel28) TaxID=656061 RepID=D5GH20_TUBMM|nr:uncharacterized protein GSTUM_00007663001 [Tuber melanosporum]CAZ83813.1 unnamed protein product [Tuber melanosporum]
MSARLLSMGAVSAAFSRRPLLRAATSRRLLSSPMSTMFASRAPPTSAGLLRISYASRPRTFLRAGQLSRSHSGAAAVRSLSFSRAIPKLVYKFARLPVAFGGATVAGLAYVQYQAQQAGTYAIGLFNSAGEMVGTAIAGAKGTAGDLYGVSRMDARSLELQKIRRGRVWR